MYIIDSDVLITAKNAYYAFDICPGFWDSLLAHHQADRVHSLDRIRQELLVGRDDDELVQWMKNIVPTEFFLSSQHVDVVTAYTEIMLWVQRNPQYSDNAKAKFATGADGWLVAYASVNGVAVVTNEQPRPEARSEIKLPDVCNQFGASWLHTFDMLRALRVSYRHKV
jgi:hypothetical protein